MIKINFNNNYKVLGAVIVFIILGLVALLIINLSSWFNERVNHQKNRVIVITIDSLRPDHLSYRGYKQETSPNIDKLANDGSTFTKAYTPIPNTVPAHISLFGGIDPGKAGIITNAQKSNATGLDSITSLFKQKDYKTGAIIGSTLVDSEFFRTGFDQFIFRPEPEFTPNSNVNIYKINNAGSSLMDNYFIKKDLDNLTFKSQIDPNNESVVVNPSRSVKDKKITELAEDWIADNKNEDFFLWLYYYDLAHYHRSKCEPIFSKKVQNLKTGMPEIRELIYTKRERFSEDNIEYLKAKYDDSVYCVDQEIGAVTAKLKELGIYEGTTIILVGDHGTSFERSLFHGDNLDQESIKIPYIVKGPLAKKWPKIIGESITLIDTYETLRVGFDLSEKKYGSGNNIQEIIKDKTKRNHYFITGKFNQTEGTPALENVVKAIIEDNNKLIITNNDSNLFKIDGYSTQKRNYDSSIEKVLKNKLTNYFDSDPLMLIPRP